jgi:hypothetical protein
MQPWLVATAGTVVLNLRHFITYAAFSLCPVCPMSQSLLTCTTGGCVDILGVGAEGG